MSLAQFITASSEQIISEWEEFARTAFPAATLEDRRDHVAGMLKAIALDLATPQSPQEQTDKSHGTDDPHVDSDSAAHSHGTDRAAAGYTPGQMVAEFRALRASVLRLWCESQETFTQAHIAEVTRFNEAIDQLLAESFTTFTQDIARSKDLLIGVIGHDLRTPLGAIMMATALLVSQEGPDWPHLRTASRILSSGTRMQGILCDLVDLTRTRLGDGIPIVRADMDMDKVCRQVVDEVSAFHPSCTVLYEASGVVRGQWDSGRIGQALSNLVGNAVQHGSDGTPIKVAVRGEPEQVVLTVHNHGVVIAEGDLQDIFSPFRQLEPTMARSRESGSLGLGLYIAHAIVTAHEGTIEAESAETGTTFTVRLPRIAH